MPRAAATTAGTKPRAVPSRAGTMIDRAATTVLPASRMGAATEVETSSNWRSLMA